ncbi:hypothetical protein SAMN05661077_1152 [Thiohalorhabdus denitrificans]|uniref:Uncharacterized protein n=1 Tax=Thiohalorhabdus denitrificans TaxID=381306 RepID=A0A1G5D335_9GAMM|nr:hypothetical protein SAMN05661077_1152 [Thiohalorhabdus denitrificans]
MSHPGFVYLVETTSPEGSWAKVGVAARITRVQDHERSGWRMRFNSFEENYLIEDPRLLEQSILANYPTTGDSRICPACGASKPPVGRNGSDGLTEVIHLDCFPDLPERFGDAWKHAKRLPRDQAAPVAFDPAQVTPPGFQLAGDPWVQHPNMEPASYGHYPCNVLCLKGVAPSEALDVIDDAWREGASDIRRELWDRFGELILNKNLLPSQKAKGSGAKTKSRVAEFLKGMAREPKVKVLLLSVRKPGRLYAYIENV